MNLTVTRLVLRNGAGEEEVRVFAALGGWEFRREHAENRTRGIPRELVFAMLPGATTWMNYLEDYLLGLRYVALSGEHMADAVRQVRAGLPVLDADEALETASASSDAELASAVRRVGVTAPPVREERAWEVFRRAFRSPAAEVRRSAILASAYPAWPDFVAELKRLRDRDPDRTVRTDAARIVIAFEQRHPG